MIDAINHGLREEMERNPKIVMWGEDVADPKGGVFGVTRGLSSAFPGPRFELTAGRGQHRGYRCGYGDRRLQADCGNAVWRLPLARSLQQLRDEIPTVRWRSQGEWECPVVVRIAVGGYIKGGPWHSANVESFFAHIPGWYVVYPELRGRRERPDQGRCPLQGSRDLPGA